MNKRAMVFLLLLAAVSTAHGARIEEDPIETRTREVSKTLRCAVCQSESVWESNSTLAKQMREIIRERVARGETVKEIQAYFVGRYGDYILLEPRKRGFNWILWIGPFILLAFGGGVLYMTLRRWVRQTAPTPPEEAAPLSEPERIRVEQERVSSEE
jgi:cytochrome c-type biogenesis protein CcmH